MIEVGPLRTVRLDPNQPYEMVRLLLESGREHPFSRMAEAT